MVYYSKYILLTTGGDVKRRNDTEIKFPFEGKPPGVWGTAHRGGWIPALRGQYFIHRPKLWLVELIRKGIEKRTKGA